MEDYPTISVITPTLNAGKQIDEAFHRLTSQNYPKDKIEIIVVDGGSTDNTSSIAKKYGAQILNNPLITSEAGKAVGLKKAKGELVIFLDSDNYIVGKDWLKQMVKPLVFNPEIVGSEPLTFTTRPEDGLITRYTALLGMGDPLMYFLGTYDRFSLLSGKWTGLPIKFEDKGDWLKVHLTSGLLPTIGANGTVLRRSIFKDIEIGDYLFDIDILVKLIDIKGKIYFAKTKNEIIHAFSSNLESFIRKQRRRIRDYFYFEKIGIRKFPYRLAKKTGVLKFIIYTVLILPVLSQAIIGYSRKRDFAWFFHPLACWITMLTYAYGWIERLWRKPEMESRQGWKQG